MRLQTASENRQMMWTWRGAAGRSRCGQRRQEKLGRRPIVVSRVRRTGSDVVDADRRRVLILRSAGWRSSDASVPFRGCIYCKNNSWSPLASYPAESEPVPSHSLKSCPHPHPVSATSIPIPSPTPQLRKPYSLKLQFNSVFIFARHARMLINDVSVVGISKNLVYRWQLFLYTRFIASEALC